MTTNNVPISVDQRELLLRAAAYLAKDGATEDLKTMLSAARLLRKIARGDQPAEPVRAPSDDEVTALHKAFDRGKWFGARYGNAAQPAEPVLNTHIDDDAVDHFAAAMKDKLAQARAKGRSGWHECDPAELSAMLRDHVEKGDPRDVANFCMFLWSLGKHISAAPEEPEEMT